MRIADVYINIPIKSIAQAFSYILPANLANVNAGWRVLVPFGGRDIEGFVVQVYSETEYSQRENYPLRNAPIGGYVSVLLLLCRKAWYIIVY